MSASKKKSTLSAEKVVGTVHSEGSLRRALHIKAGEVDLLELLWTIWRTIQKSSSEPFRSFPLPLIITVRHPLEGRANSLSLARRKELIRQFMSLANYLDVELRSVGSLEQEIEFARPGAADHRLRSPFQEHAATGEAGGATEAGEGKMRGPTS